MLKAAIASDSKDCRFSGFLLAAPNHRVMLDVGSAPCVMAALACVVHHRQARTEQHRHCRQNNQYGVFHRRRLTAAPDTHPFVCTSLIQINIL